MFNRRVGQTKRGALGPLNGGHFYSKGTWRTHRTLPVCVLRVCLSVCVCVCVCVTCVRVFKCVCAYVLCKCDNIRAVMSTAYQ
jgi:hypothetical protein